MLYGYDSRLKVSPRESDVSWLQCSECGLWSVAVVQPNGIFSREDYVLRDDLRQEVSEDSIHICLAVREGSIVFNFSDPVGARLNGAAVRPNPRIIDFNLSSIADLLHPASKLVIVNKKSAFSRNVFCQFIGNAFGTIAAAINEITVVCPHDDGGGAFKYGRAKRDNAIPVGEWSPRILDCVKVSSTESVWHRSVLVPGRNVEDNGAVS